MSLNQAHHPGTDGVVMFQGERLLIFYDGCELKLGPPLKTSCRGRIYLTSHRVVFISNRSTSGLRSFSMPFIYMRQVSIEQPVFGANRIVGKIKADPNGGWEGESNFSVTFNKGGAIEFGKTLLELGRRACDVGRSFAAPPPQAPVYGAGEYYNCPPPAYAPPYCDPYYSFVPQHEAFATPPANSLYYVGAPPPYPGAVSQTPTWTAGPNSGLTMPSPQSAINPNSRTGAESNFSCSNVSNPVDDATNIGMNGVQNAYYFAGDPHTVYAQAAAPPPPYSQEFPNPNQSSSEVSTTQGWQAKKNQ